MTGVYSPTLVALSFVIAMMASYVALDLAGRLTIAKGRAVFFWLTGGALAMGTGIWSMHFIGMLALHMPVAMAYDLPTTFASMVIAVIVSGFALFTVGRTTLTGSRLASGGVVMGFGIVGMHYTGMAAMEISPDVTYDVAVVAASAAIAVVASWAALWLAFTLRSGTVTGGIWKRIGSAAVMAEAVGLPASRSCVCRTTRIRSSMPAARRASSCGPSTTMAPLRPMSICACTSPCT